MASNEVTVDLSTATATWWPTAFRGPSPVARREAGRGSGRDTVTAAVASGHDVVIARPGIRVLFRLEAPLPNRDLVIASLHAAIWLVLVVSAGILFSRWPLSLKQLRAIELTVFGLTIAFLATAEYRLILFHSRRGDPVMAVATVKNTVIYTYAMVTLYGVFIPNTWRRAACVIIPMVAAPLLAGGSSMRCTRRCTSSCEVPRRRNWLVRTCSCWS